MVEKENFSSLIQNKLRGLNSSERDCIDNEGSKAEQDGNSKRSFADKNRSQNVLSLIDTNINLKIFKNNKK